MKILEFPGIKLNMQVFAAFIPNRILSIGGLVKSCDIYPHKGASSRSAKNNPFDKEVKVKLCSSIITGSLFALFCTDRSLPYSGKDQHVLFAIPSLLKLGPDSIPVQFTIKPITLNHYWKPGNGHFHGRSAY